MATRKTPRLTREQSAEALRSEAEAIQERVRDRAYELSQTLGSTGNDFHDWLRAEAETIVRPTFELIETKDGWKAEFAVPGLEAGDLEVKIGGGSLCLAGVRRAERKKKDERVVVSEYRATNLFREVSIPLEVDPEKVKATLEGGVLCVSLPRRKTKAPRKKAAASTAKKVARKPSPKKATAKKATKKTAKRSAR